MLNQDFLPGGFEARYQIMHEEGSGFVIPFENEQKVLEGFNKLKLFHQKSGKLFTIESISTSRGFGIKTAYHHLMFVTLTGRYLIGSRDFQSAQRGLELLKRIELNCYTDE